MKLTPNFYRDRVCLNVLAGSKENARDITRRRKDTCWLVCCQKLPGCRKRSSGYA